MAKTDSKPTAPRVRKSQRQVNLNRSNSTLTTPSGETLRWKTSCALKSGTLPCPITAPVSTKVYTWPTFAVKWALETCVPTWLYLAPVVSPTP